MRAGFGLHLLPNIELGEVITLNTHAHTEMYSLPFDVQSESPSTGTTGTLSVPCPPTVIVMPTSEDPRLTAGHM